MLSDSWDVYSLTQHLGGTWDLLASSGVMGKGRMGWGGGAQAGQLLPISPAGQQLERPLIQLIEPGLGGPLLELDIAEPALDRELVPHDFLLIGEVLFLLPGPGYGEKRSALRACTRYHSYLDPYPGPRCHCSPLEPSHPNTRTLGQTFTSQNLMTYNVTQTIRLSDSSVTRFQVTRVLGQA